jgi:hypothetical protein
VIPRVNIAYDPARPVVCSWSLPSALAEEIDQRAQTQGIDPEQLVRDLFLAHLPEFVADALGETLEALRKAGQAEGVDSS